MDKDAVEIFKKRISELFSEIRGWLDELGLKVEQGEKTIQEEAYGSYNVEYLKVQSKDGKYLVAVEPVGIAIIGAEGRVDIKGTLGRRETLVYLREGGPTLTTKIQVSGESIVQEKPLLRGVSKEGWYWVSPYPLKRAFPLTKEVFFDLISAVTNIEISSSI